MNPGILFVDDEQSVLDGLRDLLRKHRRQWDLVFALGAERAVAAIRERPFEVVVTDMRMPTMDGAALLDRVRTTRPEAVRIVLSGQMEQEAAMRAVSVAHQFLTKPCDAAILEQTIKRSLAVHGLVGNVAVRSVVGDVDTLPSPPSLHADLALVMAQQVSSSRDIARVIERDPAMSARILKCVNSSFFGLNRRVTTLEHAVAYLGLGLVRRLVQAEEAFRLAATGVPERGVTPIQRTSQLAASIARDIAPASERDDAFLTGLLADVGRLLFAARMPDASRDIDESLQRSGGVRSDLEHARLGVTHAEAGAYLLGLWGFPLPVVLAVARHHHRPGPEATSLERVTWLASWLAEDTLGVGGMDPIDPEDIVGLLPRPIEALKERARELSATGGA
jgi:HD-like signal output (HDOD) protein/CheY-like chemotaxis protein